MRRRHLIWLLAGPVSAWLIIQFTNLDPDQPAVTRMAAIAVWMALWWITEVVPLAATALIPAVMFPILGIMPENDVGPMYFNSTIMLFLGGMIIALAMERWNLHKRIALLLIRMIGLGPGRLTLGFMVATCFLSAWISNTATAMMMLPIALAVIAKLEEAGGENQPGLKQFEVGLLLAIAYAASIGGMATLVGTPPNLAFTEIYKISFGHAPEISFTKWALFGMPFSLTLLFLSWLWLRFMYCRKYKGATHKTGVFREELKALGAMSYEEQLVAWIFGLTAVLWMTRGAITIGSFTFPGWGFLFQSVAESGKVISYVSDGTVAVTMAVLLFMIPTRRPHRGMLVGSEQLQKLPWGVLLLFGGGFALAGGFKSSGLSQWCGEYMTALAGLPPLVVVLAVVVGMVLLTNLTSNTASTQMILPIMVTLAVAIQVNPLLLMIPATLAASTAYMLPAATPPNAIIFGSNRVSVAEMSRAGLALSVVSVVLIIVAIVTLGPLVFGIDLSVMPEWAGH
ncbi:SLC13/DASS family transporter [bacterium]|nr:SLC13/DASS family transporter [bacterium]